MWKVTSAACAAVLLVTILPAQSFALVPLPPVKPAEPVSITKPAFPPHSDSAPRVPGSGSGAASVAPGSVDPAESGAAFNAGPLGSAYDPPHAAGIAPLGGGGRIGDGRNAISFASFEDGDMVVVLDPGSVTGHAGLFDHRYYTGISAYAVWSANVTPISGVQREQCVKYRYYDASYGLDVPSKRAYRFQARDFAARQKGKPYSVFATKTDTRSFYCSKLAWAAYYYTAKVDLDADKGFYVWPVDLVLSRNTRIFDHWN